MPESSQERRRGRYGQQACTDRLGCIVERRRLQAYSERLARDLALPLYGTTATL